MGPREWSVDPRFTDAARQLHLAERAYARGKRPQPGRIAGAHTRVANEVDGLEMLFHALIDNLGAQLLPTLTKAEANEAIAIIMSRPAEVAWKIDCIAWRDGKPASRTALFDHLEECVAWFLREVHNSRNRSARNQPDGQRGQVKLSRKVKKRLRRQAIAIAGAVAAGLVQLRVAQLNNNDGIAAAAGTAGLTLPPTTLIADRTPTR